MNKPASPSFARCAGIDFPLARRKEPRKPSTAYAQGSLVEPLLLSSPVDVWGWEKGPLCMREKGLLASDVPVKPGKVVIRLASTSNVTFDLAWGEYGVPGSIRATYSIDVAQTPASL